MNKIILILLMPCISLSLLAQVHCGTERWTVKTLSDSDTVKIDFNQVSPSSVHAQVMMDAPKIIKDIPRRDDESLIYQIKCRVLGFKKEGGTKGDKDIHIVIEDPETHETMIAEIPDPVCQGIQGTSRAGQFVELNQWFSDNIGEPVSTFKNLKNPPTVVLTGVGFFDFNHGQTGRANNGREIHPVLSMELAEPGSDLTTNNAFVKPNININNVKSTAMETSPTPLHTLVMIILGAILGAAGQGIRVIVGMKKVYDEANKKNEDVKNLLEFKQIAISLFIGLAIGAIAGVLAAVSSVDLQFSKSVIIAFIAAGYAGTDFIEGFIKKNTIVPPTNTTEK